MKDNCSGCSQSRNCKAVYEAMTRRKGDSVTGRVFLAFLLPIFVFICVLALSGGFLDSRLKSQKLVTILNFVIAGGASFICILIVRFLRQRKNDHCERSAGR